MSKNTWIAYDSDNVMYETFTSLADAEAWLNEGNADGIGDGAMEGLSFVAQITHRTKFIETDRKELYHEHGENCPVDCDVEEWPYDNEWDVVGVIQLVEEAQP